MPVLTRVLSVNCRYLTAGTALAGTLPYQKLLNTTLLYNVRLWEMLQNRYAVY